jgi:predicted nucleic acid-binding protein
VTAAPELVFDASTVVRGLTTVGDAAELLGRVSKGELGGHAPDVIVAEVANAFTLAVRVERRALGEALQLFAHFERSALELHPIKPMAPAAIDLAVRTGLSAYDALYAVLSTTLNAPLVTADRRLAAAVPGAVLVT